MSRRPSSPCIGALLLWLASGLVSTASAGEGVGVAAETLQRWSPAQMPSDPLSSSQWATMYLLHFRDQPVQFDGRVEVIAPPSAEDSMNVPVAVRYDALPNAEEVVVVVDYNPIPKVLEFYPQQLGPFISFPVRLQQSSPVRAAVKTSDGVWHIGGRWVEAAGGGCTLPDNVANEVDEEAIGQVAGRLWQRQEGGGRLRFHLTHPNDTGLVMGVPAFFVEKLTIAADDGTPLGRLKTYEPVSANPIFSFDLPASGEYRRVELSGRDNNGLLIEASLQ